MTGSRGLAWGMGLGVPLLASALWYALAPQRGPGASPAPPPVPRENPRSRAEPSPAPATPAPPPSRAHEPPPALHDRPASEEDYFTELERLRATDREQALRYAERGDEWYSSSGKPAEARRAMAITLLVELDRMSEARARTRRFLEQYPTSPYRHLVQGQTGIHPRPGPPPGVSSP